MILPGVVLALSLFLPGTQSPGADEIAFWAARVQRDPDDHISATYAAAKHLTPDQGGTATTTAFAAAVAGHLP